MLQQPENFQGWLDTIVINKSKDYLKKKLYLVLGIAGCLMSVLGTIFIRPMLQIFVA